jgi:hypothetical protein
MGRTKKTIEKVKGEEVKRKVVQKTGVVKNLVLHNSMIRYLKHCDSGAEKTLSFLETTFKASSVTLDAVQEHVNAFVTMILNDFYNMYPRKKVISETDLLNLLKEKGIEMLLFDYDDLECPSESEINASSNRSSSNSSSSRRLTHATGYRKTRNNIAIRRRKVGVNPLLFA